MYDIKLAGQMSEQAKTRQPDEPEFLKVDEWARKRRVSKMAAYRAIKNDEVDGVVRIGRLIRIRNESAA